MVDFWCFCIAHAKKVRDGMVDFWSSLDAAGNFPYDGMVDLVVFWSVSWFVFRAGAKFFTNDFFAGGFGGGSRGGFFSDWWI